MSRLAHSPRRFAEAEIAWRTGGHGLAGSCSGMSSLLVRYVISASEKRCGKWALMRHFSSQQRRHCTKVSVSVLSALILTFLRYWPLYQCLQESFCEKWAGYVNLYYQLLASFFLS